MQYSLGVWGSMMNKSQLNGVYILPKQCVRLISKDRATMTRKYKILKFLDMIKMEMCKFGYKLVHKMLPEPLHKLMDLRGQKKTHRYNTRNKYIPNTSTSI